MGYQAGEIPMDNVHGIAVSGGSFPAEIWRLMMERTIGLRAPRDFADPKAYPVYQTFHRGPLALSYDPYYVAPTTSTTTDSDVDRHDAARPLRRQADKPAKAHARRRPSREARDRGGRGGARARRRVPAPLPGGPTRRSSRATAATSPAPPRSSSRS